ncbi:hypothetical protein NP493_3394g00000 [Ridgeia piscesae]|uniref:Helix-turn-helix domain-containing protein n=1 Tax=Ridgeia piscesae TaxID=27915 RepID=A0AAD9MXF5_RIDPI|nr:hypothetical protein NP493_3394g00000 [Ridgeia piscesae]
MMSQHSSPVSRGIRHWKSSQRNYKKMTLSNRTEMTIPHIIELLDFCLNTTYLIYNEAYYQQRHGAAMGSPISPLVANCYMEQFEKVAISTAPPPPPSLWLRYVDDTFTVLHEYDVEEFTEHINSNDPHIKFTIEPEKDSKLPFLDLCTHILDDGCTKIIIYRKPRHTDQYFNFKSHHPLTHKRLVVRTLTYREQQYVTTAEDRKSELAHVHNALRANGYPEWALTPPPSSAKRPPSTNNSPRRPMLGLPYVAGLSEQLGRIYKFIYTTSQRTPSA